MFKAQYENRQALEEVLDAAVRRPREPIPLKLTTGEILQIRLKGKDGNIISGTTVAAPHALVTIDLDTLEVTLT